MLWHSQLEDDAWPVDGFAKTDRGTKAYEFMGDAWHRACPNCEPQQTNRTWNQKRTDILNAGHQLEVIWECEWDNLLSQARNSETPLIPDILKDKQTEDDIRRGVQSGRLFGFLLCDVESPPEVIEQRKHFPPVLKREKIGFDHLTSFMREQVRREKPGLVKFERETLIQCFHAKEHLLMTPLAKYYLDNGIKITNIKKFVQYIPRRCLAPFVEHVTTMRIDAELNKMPTKGKTAKDFGNCGYGKVQHYFHFS